MTNCGNTCGCFGNCGIWGWSLFNRGNCGCNNNSNNNSCGCNSNSNSCNNNNGCGCGTAAANTTNASCPQTYHVQVKTCRTCCPDEQSYIVQVTPCTESTETCCCQCCCD